MLPGVQKVSRQGGADRVIRIEPDADKLSALNLSVVTVNEWLRGVHQNAAGGSSQYNSLTHTILILTLVDPGDRELSQKEFEHEIAPLFSELPDARYNFSNSNGGKEFSLVFTGTDPSELESAMQNLRNGIARLPGFSNVQVIKPLLRKELIVTPRPDGPGRTGMSVSGIADTLRVATMGESGSRSAKFNLPDRQLALQVVLPEYQRNDIRVLNELSVRSTVQRNVPLKAVATIDFNDGPAQIDRINRARKMSVEANLTGLSLPA